MRRLFVLLAAAGAAVVALVTLRAGEARVGEPARRRVIAEFVAQADAVWYREDLYLADANFRRLPGVIQQPQVGVDVHRNDDRVRVLVVGDSFTYGSGLTDLDARWWVRLEDELNRRTAPGAFEVVALARGGASTFTQMGWVETLASGGQVPDGSGATRELDLSQFDVVVVGYVDNDELVNGYDDYAFERYIPESAFVEVDPADEYRVISGDLANPHWDAFVEVVDDLRSELADRPFVWLTLEYAASSGEASARVRPVFDAAGYLLADNAATRSLARRIDPVRLLVNPVDAHPGPPLTARYALDGADAVLAALSAARIDRAVDGSAEIGRSLVSNHLPIGIGIDGVSPDRVVVSYDPAANDDEPCGTAATRQDRQIVCRDGLRVFVVDGVDIGTQQTPCALLGQPYAQVMLDRHLPEGTLATVALDAIDNDGGLDVYTYGYDTDGFVVIAAVGTIGVDEQLVVEVGAQSRGLIVAEHGAAACSLDRPAMLGPFQVSLAIHRP